MDAGAGPYTLTEDDPSGDGYEVTEIRCVNTQTGDMTLGDLGTRSVVLDTQPGESHHCTFTNELHGQVVIRKATAPAGDTPVRLLRQFRLLLLWRMGRQDLRRCGPGAYSVSEADPASLATG